MYKVTHFRINARCRSSNFVCMSVVTRNVQKHKNIFTTMFRKIIVNIMIFTCQEAAFLKNFVLFLNEYDCFDFESAVMHS